MAIIGGGIARAVIRAALPSLIRDGLTGAASIRHFTSWGYGIRKQDFYSLFRNVSAQVKQEDVIKSLDKFKPVPKTAFEKTDLNLSKQFLYEVEFDVYDDRGEFVDFDRFSYASNIALEPAEVEEIMSYVTNETTSGEENWTYANPTLIGALTK